MEAFFKLRFYILNKSFILSRMATENQYIPKIWAIVPAAGVGSRMQLDRPKQYLEVAGKTVLQYSLECLLQHDAIQAVQLCLSANDAYWVDQGFQHEKLLPVIDGGAERSDTVIEGLNAIGAIANPLDWVMVHDAARPCLSRSLIDRLIDALGSNSVGGILATPVAETVKKASQQDSETKIMQTVDRTDLWLAQTPQMFRYGVLRNSMLVAKKQRLSITDEASAIELAGYQPLIIESHAVNKKLTYADDIEWFRFYLQSNNALSQ